MNAETLHLSNIKQGDEIVTITPKNGKLKYSGILRVSEWSENHKAFRLVSERVGSKFVGILPPDGKGYYVMHSREIPHFYYSANPAHISAAKKIHARNKAKREKQQKLLNDKRLAFAPLLESYRDQEECYTFEYLSAESLEKLTLAQIETLKGWINGK